MVIAHRDTRNIFLLNFVNLVDSRSINYSEMRNRHNIHYTLDERRFVTIIDNNSKQNGF